MTVRNAKDIKTTDTNILIIGDAGTRKTRFAAGLPKAFVYDFDKGMASVRGQDVAYETFKEAPQGRVVTPAMNADGLYEWGTTWPLFTKSFQAMADLAYKGQLPYKHLVLDSLTFASENALNAICRIDPPKGGIIDPGRWWAQQKYIKYVLDEAVTWPVRLVCIAHVQRDKNEVTGIVEKLPLLTGKLAGAIAGYFDEVWYADWDGEGANRRDFFRTSPTPDMRQAKSRNNVPDKTPMNWEKVRPFLEGTTK